MQIIDTLLINAHVLTMDEKLTQYQPGAVAVGSWPPESLRARPIISQDYFRATAWCRRGSERRRRPWHQRFTNGSAAWRRSSN